MVNLVVIDLTSFPKLQKASFLEVKIKEPIMPSDKPEAPRLYETLRPLLSPSLMEDLALSLLK